MANKDPSKTEKPTSRRIRKAREEGNVLSSGDISSLVLMMGGAVMSYVLAPMLTRAFEETFRRIMDINCRDSWTAEDLQSGAWLSIVVTGKVLAPFSVALCLCSVAVMRMQVGKYFSTKTLHWKFKMINFQEVWSSLMPTKQVLQKLLLTMAKVTLIAGMVYVTVKNELVAIMQLATIPLSDSIDWTLSHCMIMVFKILLLFMVIAVTDWIVQRKRYYDNLMMSKQEIKDERRNMDGDPLIKSKIRQRMREILRSNMMRSLSQANVVVTNPTHVAVALKYEVGGMAPQVVAKGLRMRAERIKQLAAFYRIPIVESPPLARSLYRNIKVGGVITEQFYSAVAAILAGLHRSGKLKLKKKEEPPRRRRKPAPAG